MSIICMEYLKGINKEQRHIFSHILNIFELWPKKTVKVEIIIVTCLYCTVQPTTNLTL